MKIIIDECLPKRVAYFFTDQDVWTVPQIGLAGYKDTDLLNELNNRKIDIFITIDGNIEYQQQFENRVFATIIIRSVSNRFSDLKHFEKTLTEIIQTIEPGTVTHIPLITN